MLHSPSLLTRRRVCRLANNRPRDASDDERSSPLGFFTCADVVVVVVAGSTDSGRPLSTEFIVTSPPPADAADFVSSSTSESRESESLPSLTSLSVTLRSRDSGRVSPPLLTSLSVTLRSRDSGRVSPPLLTSLGVTLRSRDSGRVSPPLGRTENFILFFPIRSAETFKATMQTTYYRFVLTFSCAFWFAHRRIFRCQ